MNNYRILSDGLKYKIQHRSVEGLFFKKEVWKDLGTMASWMPGYVRTVYYDTLEEAKKNLSKFVEYDNKLTPWTEVK